MIVLDDCWSPSERPDSIQEAQERCRGPRGGLEEGLNSDFVPGSNSKGPSSRGDLLVPTCQGAPWTIDNSD